MNPVIEAYEQANKILQTSRLACYQAAQDVGYDIICHAQWHLEQQIEKLVREEAS
jgi:hypothetical protein